LYRPQFALSDTSTCVHHQLRCSPHLVTAGSSKMFHLNSSILRDSSVRQYNSYPPPPANPQLVISFPVQVIVPVAVALGVALGVGVSAIGQNSPNQPQLSQNDVSQILSNTLTALTVPVVSNNVPFIVSGLSFRPDGCAGVRFSDGRCYPLLSRGPCSLFQWIIVDFNSRTVIFSE
jgi:hypothetical protein